MREHDVRRGRIGFDQIGEAHDSAGGDQLGQRPAGHPHERTDSQHRQAIATVRRLVQPGQLVGEGSPDPQDGRGLLDREQQRVLIERPQHHLDDAHIATYIDVIPGINPLRLVRRSPDTGLADTTDTGEHQRSPTDTEQDERLYKK